MYRRDESQIKQQYDTAAAMAGGYIHGGGSVLGAAQSSGDARRETEVSGELARLAQTVEHLHIAAAQLTDRLVPVRTQRGLRGKDEPVNAAPEACLCLIADGIREQRKRVELAIAVLQAAFDELEI